MSTLSAARRTPFWMVTAGGLPDRSTNSLPDQADVVVVGGGLTGLSTALHVARKGATVVLVERDRIGSGASCRNGSMCTQGMTISAQMAIQRYGETRARELYDSYRKAVSYVEEIVTKESIDCHFYRAGRLGLAAKPEHFEHMKHTQELLATKFDHEVRLVERQNLGSEIGSGSFHGAFLDPLSAGLHVGKFVRGLADVAERSGALLVERCAATGFAIQGTKTIVTTTRGRVRCDQVLIATDAYTDAAVPDLQRRVVPVGSFIIVTEPLGEDLARELSPKNRMMVDSKNIGHYFRLTPDNRMMFGGRARFAPSNPESDRKSGRILQRDMLKVFPQLAGVKIDYLWGGSVGFTMDRIPHAGEMNGKYFAMGYCGHGVQMSTYMGKCMAEVMDGRPEANPWRDLTFRPWPLYKGNAWFLPIGGAYYKAKDVLK